MIVEIQVLPSPPGTSERRWANVEAAIAVIRSSGLSYEVGPLGTCVEGEPAEVWPLLRQVHEATLDAGADGVMTVVKISEARGEGPTMTDLVAPWRGER